MNNIWNNEYISAPNKVNNKKKRGPGKMIAVGVTAHPGSFGFPTFYALKSPHTTILASELSAMVWGNITHQCPQIKLDLAQSRVYKLQTTMISNGVPFQRLFITKNTYVPPHVDDKDEDGSIIFWATSGKVTGGFILYNYMMGFEITGVTMLFIKTNEITHGSVTPKGVDLLGNDVYGDSLGNGNVIYGAALASGKGVVTVIENMLSHNGSVPLPLKDAKVAGRILAGDKAKAKLLIERAKSAKIIGSLKTKLAKSDAIIASLKAQLAKQFGKKKSR